MRYRVRRSLRFALLAGLLLPACSTPVRKPAAWDPVVVERVAAPAGVASDDEARLIPVTPALMGLPEADLARGVYVSVKEGTASRFARVLACDPAADRLVLGFLPAGRSPLDDAPGRSDHPSSRAAEVEVATLRLTDALEGRLGVPLPPPTHVYAVAANFPSHLEHDLAIDDAAAKRAVLAAARPRVFLKYPPTSPPDARPAGDAGFSGVIGPFATLSAPAVVALPAAGGQAGPAPTTENRFDYEVEIGVVFGRRMTRGDLTDLDDATIRAAIAGYVLMSDAKSRNPQVVRKVAGHGQEPSEESRPYLIGDPDLDAALGAWDRTTCAWWSYAAGLGDTAAIGPYFVLADPGAPLPARPLAAARSYGEAAVRGEKRPLDGPDQALLLVQASVCTTDATHPDALFWDVPAIVRSILAEGSVLGTPDAPPVIERGDVLCLGTPGGTVITARSQGVFEVLAFLLSTWTPFDWHDLFFEDDAPLYLRTGDRLLLWADGLGAQLHDVRLLPSPTP